MLNSLFGMLNFIAIIGKGSGAHSVVEFECLLHLVFITFREMPLHDSLSPDTDAECLFGYAAFKILDVLKVGITASFSARNCWTPWRHVL